MSNNTFKPDNISYTNKDFQSIYNELLELVPKLTNKWDPNLSNESDPLVVLLKLNALLADKNDYNIDKNVLELFPLSVTQRGNAQKIYDSLGYSLRWYESASTEVNLRWIGEPTFNGTINLGGASGEQFLMVTDESGEIVYTIVPTDITNLTLETPVKDLQSNEVVTSKFRKDLTTIALEGTVHDYEINGNNLITLQNLDSNLRLYFTEQQVAENGIFIQNIGDTSWIEWNRVDNLESESLGKKSYKFGVLPNSSTCYIEFPQDIANLIGQGINIKYIISSGSAGTIQPNTLTGFYTDITTTVDDTTEVINDKVRIWNANASSEGRDPEDLDDAYKNYQKVVATFNTLVTCRDYENVIFRLRDEVTGKPLVSNCVVADRTNDIGSVKVQSLNINGNNISLSENNTDAFGNPQMSAFDLKLYLLNYISPITTGEQYNNTFKPDPSLYVRIPEEIDEYKHIQHNFPAGFPYFNSTSTSVTSPFIYEVRYNIDCQLTTYNKVSEKESRDIEKNAYAALYKNYNAREIEFGESIEYSDIVSKIQNSDKRIKDVILAQPTLSLWAVDANGNSTEVLPQDEIYSTILNQNILAGTTQGIKYDNRFNYEFFQEPKGNVASIINNIVSITTDAGISLPTKNDEGVDGYYSLKPNETVTLYSPNFIADKVYSNYLYYVVKGNSITISSKEDIVRLKGTSIDFYNKKPVESNNQITNTEDFVGSIPDGSYVSFSGWGGTTTISGSDSLGATKTITSYKQNLVNLTPQQNGDNNTIYCYWILNNPGNKFFPDLSQTVDTQADTTNFTYFLKNGEYFLYPNNELTELNILGSGTSIIFPTNPDEYINTSDSESSTIDPSNVLGTSISNIDWFKISLTKKDTEGNLIPIKVIENSIINLGYGTSVKLKNVESDNKLPPSGTEAVKVTGSYIEEAGGNPINLPGMPEGSEWRAYATINLIGSKNNPLNLYEGQTLTLNNYTPNSDGSIPIKDDGNIEFNIPSPEVVGPALIQFSSPIALPGGEKVNVGTLGSTSLIEYNLSAYIYDNNYGDNIDSDPYPREGEYRVISLSTSSSTASITVPKGNYIIPFIWVADRGNNLSITTADESTDKTLKVIGLNSLESISPRSNNYAYFLNTSNIQSLTFKLVEGTEGTLNLGKLHLISEDSSIPSFDTPDSGNLDSGNLFDYTYEVPEITNIKEPASPEGMLNPNNILNRFTIAKMNTKTSEIRVLNSSKL